MQRLDITLYANQDKDKNHRWQKTSKISFYILKYQIIRIVDNGKKSSIKSWKVEIRFWRKKNEKIIKK